MTIVDQIINDIKTNPQNWKRDTHYFMNKIFKINLWISNGPWFVETKKGEFYFNFNLLDKWRIWFAFRSWDRNQVIDLGGEE